MKISYNWLKDYVDIQKSPAELADDLSLFGHEVEAIEKVGDDYVLDLEITPNRGDCLSILGLAREISALYNIPLKKEKLTILRSIDNFDRIDKKIEVRISDPEICPRFTARIIDNIKIAESPKWLQERLASYGFRPINNIVDITNYVMIATGQPLHAFDYNKIKDGKMNIRQAREGEEVMTLDGQNRILNAGAIIIEDSEKIYDLAGIMGGIKSEIDENTKTIVLQGAIFDPILIRLTSKYLNHTTDASYRYERGVDFEGTIGGVALATALIKESCPEAKIGQLIDIKSKAFQPTQIEFDLDKINKLIGFKIDNQKVIEYLSRLGFKVENNLAIVPSYRADEVKIWQDLAEEIARMYGYNNINKNQISKIKNQNENLEWTKREYLKDILKNLGFTEIYSYSFAEKDKIELLGGKIDTCVEIANPLSSETQFLRDSILPSLLGAIAKNPWAPEVNIFEVGKVFSQEQEKWQLGIAIVGKDSRMLEEAKLKLNIDAEIKPVDQKILAKYKIRKPVQYLLIDLDKIMIEVKEYSKAIFKNKYQKISSFAPTVRDLAFIVSEDVAAKEMAKAIAQISEKILLVEPFDEYASDKFGPHKKNLAFHLWLQELNKPLAETTTQEIINKVIARVEEQFPAQLRSKIV